MPSKYIPRGPTEKRIVVCFACGRGLPGKGHLHDRPVAFRDVEFRGYKKIRVIRTVYCDELDHDEMKDQLRAQVKNLIARYAASMGLEFTRETVREVLTDEAKRRIAHLEAKLAELASRPDAEKPHRPAKRAKVRAGARRIAGLYGAPAQARAGSRCEDGLEPLRELSFESLLRRPRRANVRPGGRSEDGL